MFPPPVNRIRAEIMRREPTFAEKVMWDRLRNRKLAGLKFRRQAPIGPYIADFLCKEARLIVEFDGPHHDADYDAKRDAWLGGQGYRVLRFPNNDVGNRMAEVLERIRAAAGK
ncbi:MAG TPA: endonuclease domain-containing protein [Caulobacter sp.]|nr:endonuclease domain-containing protein [Caulobacter sp.]